MGEPGLRRRSGAGPPDPVFSLVMVAEAEEKSKVKRVWILGAGFSRPLGGPLLSDLFSMKMWREVSYIFPQQFALLDSQMSEELAGMLCVYLLYQHGRKFPDEHLFGYEIKGKGELLYQHAEDFLVKLEMLTPHELWSRLRRVAEEQIVLKWKETDRQDGRGNKIRERGIHNEIVDRAWDIVHRANHHAKTEFLVASAKRLMAYECSAFHQEILEAYSKARRNDVIEPYIPYQDWGKALVPRDDVVLTFNYDLVFEDVVKTPEVELLKLHGSVDTSMMSGGVKLTAYKTYAILSEQGHVPDIKTPGRSKAQMTAEDKALWEKAGAYIEQAEKVVFLGYGLPESDAYARKFLLQHLRRNRSNLLKIEIVLGQPNFRTERLQETLGQALAHRVHTQRDREAYERKLDAAMKHRNDMATQLEHVLNGRASIDTERGWREKLRLVDLHLDRLPLSFPDLQLHVKKQYAQDYMQGFATNQGGS